jgi:YidC/Oxa1 family membrane protein insertase
MAGDSDNKNLILAAVLSMAVVFAWQMFVVPPPPPPADPAAGEGQAGTIPAATTDGTTAGTVPVTETAQTRGEALAGAPRVAISTPALSGSVALTGGRLHDLHLSLYRETLEPGAETVVLLNPAGGPAPYFIDYGWRRTVDSDPGPLPGAATPWTVETGDKLTVATPVTLRWDNGKGLTFRRKFEVDDRYMFTVTQSVENTTGNAVALAPYGVIARRGEPDGIGFYILHEGAVGVFDGELSEVGYDEIRDMPVSATERGPAEITPVGTNGWLGFTDKYWMTTLAPQPGQTFDAVYRMVNVGGSEEFRTEMRLPVLSAAPGATVASVTNLFAGAKEVATIRHYQETRGIDKFEDAVDWGWFYFLTKPIFRLLAWVHGLVGNMGWSIIVLTLLVKAALFPLAYKSYVSMSKMKMLQPEMEKLKERVGDDKQKLQQEMMALYKKEKVNPAAGCLPILLQIPIFFSLYKVLFVTIEMRHAPFIGWIHDLSAPDPTSFLNLFGLLDFQIPAFLAIFSIGVYPIIMGITMWMQQKLNPAPTDPTQKMIFAWMPWVFMFMLGQFASGLVIYWCANNIITFLQQYAIMRSQGAEIDLMGNITSGFKKNPVAATAKPPAKAKAVVVEDEAGNDAPASDTPDARPAKKPARKTARKAADKPSRKRPGKRAGKDTRSGP